MPAAFGPEWQITLDGDAGEFTETLEIEVRAPADGQHAVGVRRLRDRRRRLQLPVLGPGAVRSQHRHAWCATLLEAGVKHVFWVTLREIKPQYVSPGAWRQIQPYYWYFPTVNDHLEQALARNPSLSLIDWAAVADQPGLTYDAIHLNTPGAALYSAILAAGRDRRHHRRRRGRGDADRDPRRGRRRRGGAQPHHRRPAGARLPHRLRLRPAAAGGQQPQLHPRPDRRPRRDRARQRRPARCASTTTSPTNLVVDITGRFGDDAGDRRHDSKRLVDTRDRGTKQPALTPLPVDVGDAPDARSCSTSPPSTPPDRAGCERRRATRPTRRRR